MVENERLDRRTLLRGSAGLVSLSLLAGKVAAAAPGRAGSDGVPEEARSIEAGFEAFVATWNAVGPAVTTGQFGAYLVSKTFNCYVADDDRAYTLRLGPEGGASFSPGADPGADVSLTVDAADWKAILYGDYSGLAPALAGRVFAPKSQVNEGALLAIVLYILAHVPASLAHDADANAETLQGIFERQGATDCGSDIGHREDPAESFVTHRERTAFGTANRAPDVTAELADRTAALAYDDLPEATVDAAKTQLKSILGVTYAAGTLAPGTRFVEAVEALGGGDEATVVGGGYRASAEDAAMANSYLAQMLEWEDWTFMAHTGSAVVPTALAAAELAGERGDPVSGAELVTAIALGNEIAGRTGVFLTDPTNLGQSLPVHQTELPFVAGKLLGLDSARLRDASGIAGTQPQTTAIPTWTADSKGLVGGEPAQTSVRAARLAAEGVHGRRDHLGNVGGYWYRVSDILNPENLALAYRGLGDQFFFRTDQRGEFFDKRYPCDGFTQTAVHATLDVREQLRADGIDPAKDPAAVEEIHLRMNTALAATGTLFNAGEYDYIQEKILDAGEPDWTYTALLFDGKYPLAAALLEGELTHRQYRPEVVGDSRVRHFYESVEAMTDVSVGQFGAEVSVVTSDGTFESLVGAPQRLGESEYESFVGCIREEVTADFSGRDKLELAAGDVLSRGRIRRIDRLIDDIERVRDVRRLTALL